MFDVNLVLIELIICLICNDLINQTFINASTIKFLKLNQQTNFKKSPNSIFNDNYQNSNNKMEHNLILQTTSTINNNEFKKLKRSQIPIDIGNFDVDLAEEEESNDEEQAYNNQTQITAEELINKKNKEIVRSQEILFVLIIGLIVLLFAISKIIMSLGKSIDNRKYLLMQY